MVCTELTNHTTWCRLQQQLWRVSGVLTSTWPSWLSVRRHHLHLFHPLLHLLLVFLIPKLALLGNSIGDNFACVTLTPLYSSYILSLDAVYAGIRSSRTWMSGGLWSMWWNACTHSRGHCLYSHPKEQGVAAPAGIWSLTQQQQQGS